MKQAPKVYISSSWANRDMVRLLANRMREHSILVFDFTDPECRPTMPIPPEAVEGPAFDPAVHAYASYMQRVVFLNAVNTNRIAIETCDFAVLLLPCGCDSHADWAYAVGKGKSTCVLGHPKAGERTPTHLWANYLTEDVDKCINWILGCWNETIAIAPIFK